MTTGVSIRDKCQLREWEPQVQEQGRYYADPEAGPEPGWAALPAESRAEETRDWGNASPIRGTMFALLIELGMVAGIGTVLYLVWRIAPPVLGWLLELPVWIR